MERRVNDTNSEALMKTADLTAIGILFTWIMGALPTMTLIATFVWAIFRALSEYETWKHKRAERLRDKGD